MSKCAGSNARSAQLQGEVKLEFPSAEQKFIWARVDQLVVLGMAIPPLIGNPYDGYINPYYWVDDHPLFYGNNGSLDPGSSEKLHLFFPKKTVIVIFSSLLTWPSFLSTKNKTFKKKLPICWCHNSPLKDSNLVDPNLAFDCSAFHRMPCRVSIQSRGLTSLDASIKLHQKSPKNWKNLKACKTTENPLKKNNSCWNKTTNPTYANVIFWRTLKIRPIEVTRCSKFFLDKMPNFLYDFQRSL